MTDKVDIQKLRELVEKMTPERWCVASDGTHRIYGGSGWGVVKPTHPDPARHPHDAAGICALRNTAPALLDELESLRATVAAVEKERDEAAAEAAAALEFLRVELSWGYFHRDMEWETKHGRNAELLRAYLAKTGHGFALLDELAQLRAVVAAVEEVKAELEAAARHDGLMQSAQCQLLWAADLIAAALKGNTMTDKDTNGQACPACGQSQDPAVYGEYPCATCGVPTLHDEAAAKGETDD